jgi:hypothetical protein
MQHTAKTTAGTSFATKMPQHPSKTGSKASTPTTSRTTPSATTSTTSRKDPSASAILPPSPPPTTAPHADNVHEREAQRHVDQNCRDARPQVEGHREFTSKDLGAIEEDDAADVLGDFRTQHQDHEERGQGQARERCEEAATQLAVMLFS